MRSVLPSLYWLVAAAVLLWDIQLAGRIARNRRAPRLLALLSGLAGLLIAPAAIAAAAAPSVYSGRAVQSIDWLWPVVNAIVALQVLYAVLRRWVTPALGIPFLLYDLVLLGVSVARHMVLHGGDPAAWVVGLSAAHASALGLLLGERALYWPVALQLPLLSPVLPARWRLSAVLRGGLALFASAWAALVIIVEYPRAVRSVNDFARYDDARLQERPAGDFAVGLQIFPTLGRAPTPQMVSSDFALRDSLDVDAVSVTIAPEAARPVVLDSLARLLDDVRRDSTVLIVSLGFPSRARESYRASPARYTQARMLELRRILRTLRPDIVVPVVEPYGEGERALGTLPLADWQRYLSAAAQVVQEVRPRTQVAVSAAAYNAPDSALYAWAASRTSPIEIVGFSFEPSFGGALSLAARLAAADRWLAADEGGAAPKPHWVLRAVGDPLAFGEQSQRRGVWGTLAWATSHPQLRGVVVADAADYARVTGLRVTGGRLRPVAASVAQAVRMLRESIQTVP